jgi:hypothetical protein
MCDCVLCLTKPKLQNTEQDNACCSGRPAASKLKAESAHVCAFVVWLLTISTENHEYTKYVFLLSPSSDLNFS